MRDMLKARRLELGLIQSEVAERLGRIRTFVSKYEKGERILTFTEVVELCKLLSMDIQDFVQDANRSGHEEEPVWEAAEDGPEKE